MAPKSKDILDEIMEILAQIEGQLNSLDYGAARHKALELVNKGKGLLDSILREGRVILLAEQVAVFKIMIGAFGTTKGAEGFDPRADLNGDGVINTSDFGIFSGDFLG